jgi:hypothetical protein
LSDPVSVLTGAAGTPARSERAMRRLTVSAVSVALVIWGMLAVFAGRSALDVLRYSSAPAASVLEQTAGVVLYREADQRNDLSAQPGMQLFDGDELATSFGSTAVLQIFDGTRIELFPEGRVRIEASRIGRFNAAATQARLAVERGAARVTIPPSPDGEHSVSIATPHARAAFTPGAYTLRVGQPETRVSVWEGQARVLLSGDETVIEAGDKLVATNDPPGYRRLDALENIIANGSFRARFEGWDPWEEREQGRPDVPGRIEIEGDAGSSDRALRVWRESLRDAHNETGLRQRLGRDVNGARAIVLEARVRVDFSSLSGGGYLGSEYPMMLRLRARDRRSSEQIWTQGFYYENAENRPTPTGRMISRGEWTEYRVDLTEALSQVATIESIEVFGAGHTFDASITDVRLLVD